jgi:hypothetical protein
LKLTTVQNELTFEKGQKLQVPVSGTHQGVTFSSVQITVEDVALEEVKDFASSHNDQHVFDGNGNTISGAEVDAMIKAL